MNSVRPLSDLTTLISRGIAPKYTDERKTAVINQKCIRDGQVNLSLSRFHDHEIKGVPVSKIICPKDILVNSTGVGTLGRVSQVVHTDGEMTVDSHVTIVRPDISAVDPDYLGAFLFINQMSIEALGHGSTGQTELSRHALGDLEVRLPSRDHQKFVGQLFQKFHKKIELNQKMNQTLEEIAKAIFKSWFVDFDPVRAKAKGRPTGLPPEINDMFPDELVESEIGEIPKGWEIAELSKYVDVLNGFAFKSKDYESDGVFVLRTKNFDQGLVKKLPDDVFLPSSFLTSNSKHVCEPYDYHLVMVGASIGSRGMLFPHQLPALRNQNMWCFRSKNKSNFSQLLVKLYLDNFIESKMGLASGSAREFFRKGDFQSHRLSFATPSLREYFSNCYSIILEKIQNNLAQIEALSELRDTLLPKLISGELRIPDAEKFLEEAGI